MASSSTSSPWPAPTPPPFVDHHQHLQQRAPKRRRTVERRQGIADQRQVDKALVDCQIYSGNYVYSCYPTADTRIDQHKYASFVWNSQRPELTQTNLVDIFLFRADKQQQLLHFTNVTNPSDQAGLIRTEVNDAWFGSDGLNYSNANQTFPFYWVIIRSDKTLDGNQIAQPIFTAVQTTVLDSVASASASASLAAASSSAALAASLSSLSAARTAASTGTGTNTSLPTGVLNASSSTSFPRWAIAVIVVLGFLAIAALCLLAFLVLRRLRRRRNSDRNSMESASPMIRNNRDSVTTGGGYGGSTQGGHGSTQGGHRSSSTHPQMMQRYDSTAASPLLPPIGAFAAGGAAAGSTTHDAGSSESGGLFSVADAAIMADAFRNVLRDPAVVARRLENDGHGHVEGGSYGTEGEAEVGDGEGDTAGALRDQLAEEGRDIWTVDSSRGVKVESPS